MAAVATTEPAEGARERLSAFVGEVVAGMAHVRQRANALVYVRGLIEHGGRKSLQRAAGQRDATHARPQCPGFEHGEASRTARWRGNGRRQLGQGTSETGKGLQPSAAFAAVRSDADALTGAEKMTVVLITYDRELARRCGRQMHLRGGRQQ